MLKSRVLEVSRSRKRKRNKNDRDDKGLRVGKVLQMFLRFVIMSFSVRPPLDCETKTPWTAKRTDPWIKLFATLSTSNWPGSCCQSFCRSTGRASEFKRWGMNFIVTWLPDGFILISTGLEGYLGWRQWRAFDSCESSCCFPRRLCPKWWRSCIGAVFSNLCQEVSFTLCP